MMIRPSGNSSPETSVPDPFRVLDNDALGLVFGHCGVRDVMCTALGSKALYKRVAALIVAGKLPQLCLTELEVSSGQFSWIAQRHPSLARKLSKGSCPLQLLKSGWHIAELLSTAAVADAIFERQHGLASRELTWALKLASCVPQALELKLEELIAQLPGEDRATQWRQLEPSSAHTWFCTPHGTTEPMLRARAEDWKALRAYLRDAPGDYLFKANDSGDTLLTTLLTHMSVDNRDAVRELCGLLIELAGTQARDDYDKALALACYQEEWDLALQLLERGANPTRLISIHGAHEFCAATKLLSRQEDCAATRLFREQSVAELIRCLSVQAESRFVWATAVLAPELYIEALKHLDPEKGYYSPLKGCKEYPVQLLAVLELAGHGQLMRKQISALSTDRVGVNACYPSKGSQPLLHQVLRAHDNENCSSEDSVAFLLELRGIRVDQPDHAGVTAALIAASHDNYAPILMKLLEAGADFHQSHPATKESLLHFACKSGAVVCMRQLLQRMGNPQLCLLEQADASGLSPALYSYYFTGADKQLWVEKILRAKLDRNQLYSRVYACEESDTRIMEKVAQRALVQFQHGERPLIGAFHLGVMPQAFLSTLLKLNIDEKELRRFLSAVIEDQNTVELWLSHDLKQQEGPAEWRTFTAELHRLLPLHTLTTAGRATIERLLEACRHRPLGMEEHFEGRQSAVKRCLAWLQCDPETGRLRSTEKSSMLNYYLDHDGDDEAIMVALSAHCSSPEKLDLFTERLRRGDSPERIKRLLGSVSPEQEKGSPEFKHGMAAWTVRTCEDEALLEVLATRLRQRFRVLLRNAAAAACEQARERQDLWVAERLAAFGKEKKSAKRRLNFNDPKSQKKE